MFTLNCPNCRRQIEVPSEAIGTTVPCSHCGHPVAVTIDSFFGQPPGAAAAPVPIPAAEVPAAPAAPPGAPPAGPPTAAPPRGAPGSLRHMLRAVLFSALFFAVLYGLYVSPVAKVTSYPEKFIRRGWTQYACVLLTFWSLSMLHAKWRSVKRRRACLAESAPPESARLDSERGVVELRTVVQASASRHKDDTLSQRVERAIELFRSSRSAQEASQALLADSDAAYAELESSDTLVRVFLWAIPILGFIGTVMGIGDAVGGFATFLGVGVQELDDIKKALTDVTSNLAVAFDTTLVALLLSLVVMIILSAVEKREKDLLQAYEDFCQRLLRGLSVAGVGEAAGAVVEALKNLPKTLRESLDGLPGALGAAVSAAGRDWLTGVASFQQEVSDNRTAWSGATGQMVTCLKEQPQQLREAVVHGLKSVVPEVDFWKTEAPKMAKDLADSLASTWRGAGQEWSDGLERFGQEAKARQETWEQAAGRMLAQQENVQQYGTRLVSQVISLLDNAARALAEARADSERQWASALQELRTDAAANCARQQETAGQLVQEREALRAEAARRFEEIQGLLAAERRNLEDVLETFRRATTETTEQQQALVQPYTQALLEAAGKLEQLIGLQVSLEQGLLRAAGSDGLSATLQRVQGMLEQMDPFMRRLASEPLNVRVQFLTGLAQSAG